MNVLKSALFLLVLVLGISILAKDKKEKFQIISADASYELKNGIELLKNNKLKKAEKAFDKAISEFELFYQAYAYKAIIAAQKADFPRSKELFEESLLVFDKYKEFIITKRQIYINETKAKEMKLRVTGNNRAGAVSIDGYQQMSTRDMQARLEHRLLELENELEEDNNMQFDAFFCFKYGNTLMALKDAASAKAQYLAAVQENPEYNETYANLSLVYFMEQDYAKALEIFEKGKALGTAFHPKYEETLRAQMKGAQ